MFDYLCFQLLLSLVWLEFRPIHYNFFVFPQWSIVVGWTISLSPVFIIFFTFFYQFARIKGSFSRVSSLELGIYLYDSVFVNFCVQQTTGAPHWQFTELNFTQCKSQKQGNSWLRHRAEFTEILR